MIIYFLMCIYFMSIAAKDYDGSTFEELLPNSQQIWHSYVFNTGAANREELHISNIELDNNSTSGSNIFMWKSLQIETDVVIVGLSNDFLLITTISGGNNSFTYRHEIQEHGKALTVFQKWNAKTQAVESFIVVATHSTKENYKLMWYQILHRRLEFLWDWQCHSHSRSVIHMDVIEINYESKLLVVNEKYGTNKNPSTEIYSFHLSDELDIWMFEKITLNGTPSSVGVFESSDNAFFYASYPLLGVIHIFKYSKCLCTGTLESKHFVSHQKIFTSGLKSVTPFQIGFHWYLAVASSSSLIYRLGEDLTFHPLSSHSLGPFNSWLVIPVDTYREDTLLLADSDSDVSVLACNGDKNVQVIGSFTRLACRDDVNCSEQMKGVELNKSTAFTQNGHQSVVLSSRNGNPLLFKLFMKLKPLPNKAVLKLKEISNEKILLERDYKNQLEKLKQLSSERENSSRIDSTVFSGKMFEAKQGPEILSKTRSQQQILTDLNGLKTAVESLNVDIDRFITDVKSVFSQKEGQNSRTFFPRNATDGVTFFGDVVINDLNLSSINGHSMNELLTDSFRKNKASKIGGMKTLKKLKAENVIFEKLGDTLACDIMFSDDPWESQNKNILNGDIVWDSKVNVLGDVKISEGDPKQNSSSVKIPGRTLKPVYDELSFKELEVTEDFHVQRNINGQPIILPVHSGHLNILDIVNHARFEMVNVEHDLHVRIINGINFTSLAEKILSSASRPQFDFLRVEGAFSAPAIQAEQFDGVRLQASDSDAEEIDGKQLPANGPFPYEAKNNLEKNRNENLKRTIHVFENLEVEGIIFSNKINNIGWRVLNDTVKKSEETVNLFGAKKFEKSLRIKKAILNGTLNGRFLESVLNNFSDQTLKYPQVFDVVKFINLSLEGAWNGIYINHLNESVVRLSSDNSRGSSLTFEKGCFVNALNVTNAVNNLSVNVKLHEGKNDGKINLKSIKAAHVILHGSLITNNKINNLNLTDFNLLRISLKYPETINEDIYRYNVSVSGDLNVETLNLNDVSSIINSRGDGNFIENFLNGEINRIKKLLVKGNITTSRGVNGFRLPEIFQKGIRITKGNSIKGNVTFENIVYFDNINVTGSVDGVPLKHLEKDIAFNHSQVFLTGPKNFSTLRVMRNMRGRTLNGHGLEGVLTLRGDHTIRGPVHINGNVIVKGNVTSYSAINNATVTDLLQTYSTQLESYIYSGDLDLSSDDVTIRNLMVSGKIQNVSLDALLEDSLRKDSLSEVSGRKTFKGETKFKGNVAVEGFVHGVNFSKFYADLAFTNKPAKLGGTVTIQELALKDLDIVAHFNSTLINNIDTNDWLEDSIPLDRYKFVNGKKTFAEVHSLQDISVDFINGHLPSAMITLKGKQNIPTVASFPRMHATSDLSVEGFVNGKNLLNEFEDSVLVNGPQTITGKTTFSGEFFVNGSVRVDTIKGKPVDSLITLDTEQVIKTPLQFTGLVTAKQNVENVKLINDISLGDWNEKSVQLNKNQVVNGLWTVRGKVRTKGIEGEGTFHSVNLENVWSDIQKARSRALELKNATEMEYSAQYFKVDQLSQQFSELPYLLHQFATTDEIETPSAIDSAITFKIGKAHNLIVTFENECLSSLYHWNRDTARFDHKRQINIGPVSKWLAVHRDEETYLITSSSSGLVCEENLQGGNIWVFKGEVDGYAHLLTTNAFVDIAQENATSDEFFTIDENGLLQRWTLRNGNVTFEALLNLGSGHYRFIDFRIMKGLSVSNGREIKQIARAEDGRITQRTHLLSSTHIMALPLDWKVLAAVVLKDKIVVYENLLEERIYSIIHIYKAGSVLWLNFGPKKQAFLIVASHHKLIEVYEYKGVSGLVKKMSIQMFSSRLQSVNLPGNKYQCDKFIIVIQKKKLSFAKAEMFGDYFLKSDSIC